MRTKQAGPEPAMPTGFAADSDWIETEVGGCHFRDVRLGKRFKMLLRLMAEGMGESVPYACQDWANTKAAYRFFSNEAVSEAQIMAGHFEATGDRLSQAGPRILMLHDTCEFSFRREEESKLRSSERLANLIAIFCIIGWRIFWLTMLHRAAPDLPPAIALDPTEAYPLDKLVKTKAVSSQAKPTISDYIIKIARLGGYLNRASDPPPGNMVMWRGLSKLNEIHLGFLLGRTFMGN